MQIKLLTRLLHWIFKGKNLNSWQRTQRQKHYYQPRFHYRRKWKIILANASVTIILQSPTNRLVWLEKNKKFRCLNIESLIKNVHCSKFSVLTHCLRAVCNFQVTILSGSVVIILKIMGPIWCWQHINTHFFLKNTYLY